VRNAISEVGRDQTITRKIREAAYAYNVDQGYSKDKILELYLNTVYFGEGAYGVQTASRTFFGKDVEQISLAEAALLAALIKSPVNFNPRTNADAALNRRNLVLDRMFINKFANEQQVAEGKGVPLGIQEKIDESRYPAPFFIDYVTRLIQRSEEFKALGETEFDRGNSLFRRGLRVHTTLDLHKQAAAEEAVAKVLDRPNDPSASLVAIDPKNGYIKAIVGGKDYFATLENDPCVTLGAINADGSPKTCAKVNLALGQGGGGSGRQTGSAFKPFVLAAALEKGIRLTDVYNASACIDIPFADGGNRPWHVCNYDESGSGGVTVRESTARSINTVYAQILVDVGGKNSKSRSRAMEGAQHTVALAERMGICGTTTPLLSDDRQCKLEAVPSAALGANAVSTMDMAAAFTPFAMLGQRAKPVGISRITDAGGKILWEPSAEMTEVLKPQIAHLANSALQDVITRGTASRSGRIGRPAFGKTGTAQEWRDAWFVGGAGTDLVAAVAVGWPDGEIEMKPSCSASRREYRIEHDDAGNPIAHPPKCRASRIKVSGGTWPTQIWQIFMLKALEGVPASSFPTPGDTGVVKVQVDISRGCLPNQFTLQSDIKTQEYIEGTQPTEVCTEPTEPVTGLVPNVIGFPRDDAVAALEREGFSVQLLNEETRALPPGRVARQSPSPGSEAEAGKTTVVLWISVDPKARAEAAADRVPNVVGMNERDAKGTLLENDYAVETVREGPCGGGNNDRCRVYWQDPSGSSPAPKGSVVTIYLRDN
ncbi:MAG TPA: transglycosylase domain-containing protein, partial [Actinomycetota bacterium]|nr:transglycosylase domain-containing protein [Actinomycetota bacterium]